MPYSLAEAAQATASNRRPHQGQRDASVAWSVEPVEVHRVFPPAEAMPNAVPQHAQPIASDAATDALVTARVLAYWDQCPADGYLLSFSRSFAAICLALRIRNFWRASRS
jgi:hypothetical protein